MFKTLCTGRKVPTPGNFLDALACAIRAGAR